MTNGKGQHADLLSLAKKVVYDLRSEKRQRIEQLTRVTADLGQAETALQMLMASRPGTTFVGGVTDGEVHEDQPPSPEKTG